MAHLSKQVTTRRADISATSLCSRSSRSILTRGFHLACPLLYIANISHNVIKHVLPSRRVTSECFHETDQVSGAPKFACARLRLPAFLCPTLTTLGHIQQPRSLFTLLERRPETRGTAATHRKSTWRHPGTRDMPTTSSLHTPRGLARHRR